MANRAVFVELYQLSDEAGEFELNAVQLSEKMGISRRAIYNAISFLKRVNLLFVMEAKTGRGNHSRYRLNWRKPVSRTFKRKSARPNYSQEKPKVSSHNRKCADISINKTKSLHISYDRENSISATTQPENSKAPWNRMMKSFRELMGKTWLMRSEQNICVGVLGRYIKNKSVEFSRSLYESLVNFCAQTGCAQLGRIDQRPLSLVHGCPQRREQKNCDTISP